VTAIGPVLQAFFTERLVAQRRASPHTVAAYRDTFCLLFGFLQAETAKAPSALQLEDIDADVLGRFLQHLERDRHNSVRTRNARLSALRSFFRFAVLHHPEHAGTIGRVLALPPKRFERQLVSFLTDDEVDALLDAPDCRVFLGRRDHALLLLAVQTGLRVSELVSLTCGDVVLGTGAHVSCSGKGRKQRITPLTKATAAAMKQWLRERQGRPGDPLFPTAQGLPLSRYGVSVIVARHAKTASESCPSLANKKLSPHVLRHTAAMRLLHAGVDTSVIALWLGHEGHDTTQMYLHADLSLKERAIAMATPLNAKPGRYRPPDKLLAFLESL
jgi:integrase/recombinase XerD